MPRLIKEEDLIPDPTVVGEGTADIEFSPGEQGVIDEEIANLKKNWGRYAGATGGSVIGTAVAGFPVGTVGGAIFGGASGKYGQMKYEDEEIEDNVLLAEELTKAGLTSGAEELVGHAMLAPLRPLFKRLAPFKRKVTPEGQIAWDVLEKYMPKSAWTGLRKPPITPGEMTESRILDLTENVAERSLIGGSSMRSYKQNRMVAMNQLVDDLGKVFGQNLSEGELGTLVEQVIKGEWKEFKELITKPLYNTVEEIVKPDIVRVPIVKEVASEVLDSAGNPIIRKVVAGYEEKAVGGAQISIESLKNFLTKDQKVRVAKALKVMPGGEETGDSIIAGIMKLPDTLDYAAAKELRTRLGAAVGPLQATDKKAPAIGLTKKLRGMLTDEMDKGLKAFSPEAHSMWKDANKLYETGGDMYNNKFLRSILKQADPKETNQPSKVVGMIFQNKNTDRIKMVKNAVDQKTWNKLKTWYLQDVLTKSTTPGDPVPWGDSIWRRTFGPNGMGEEALSKIFEKSELESFKNVMTTLQVAQQRLAEGQGGMLIQLMQAGSAGALLAGKWEKVAWSILLLPEVFARMAMNPTASRALTQGLIVPAPAPGALLRITNAAETVWKEVQQERMQKRAEELGSIPSQDTPF
jgi:hypothetical protein